MWYCGKVFKEKAECNKHENVVCTRKNRWQTINKMWEKGHTLGEINDEYHIIKKLPDGIRSATKTTVLLFAGNAHWSAIDGNIEKFVSTHIVFISHHEMLERTRHFHYSDFKYMSILENTANETK